MLYRLETNPVLEHEQAVNAAAAEHVGRFQHAPQVIVQAAKRVCYLSHALS